MATPPNQMGLTGPVQANDIVMRASEIGTTIPGIASLAMKSARKGAQRGVQGIYQLPSGQEPTPEFMNVSQQNLNNQTRQMADMLNMLAPKDEQLAYINEEEAGILRLLGGSGTTENNPAGIPSFMGHHGGGSTSSSGATGTGGVSPGPGGPGGGMVAGATPDGQGGSTGGTSEGFGGEAGGPVGGEPDRDYKDSVAEAAEQEVDKATLRSLEDRAAEAEARERATVRYGDDKTVTSSVGDVISRTQFDRAMQDYNDQKAYARGLVDAMSVNPMARQMRSMDPDYGYVDAGDVSSESLGSMSAQGTLDNMQDRLGELSDLAKENNITNTQLDEMGQLNSFFGNNPTQGMGLTESLRYQFTNQAFKDDIAKAGPVLGTLALTALAPAQVKSVMGLYKMMQNFSKSPTKSLRTTIEDTLAKLGVKEKEALANTLPSTYRGFGIEGRGGSGGGGRQDQRQDQRQDTDTSEEEDTRERDRFNRAFANRYFIGPASLEEVRKYAITGGGYDQLTPFYGQERETV